tara:strand:- start:201 stop:467 length:267 start_codon:yes stop_codon:yes gene_type:complete
MEKADDSSSLDNKIKNLFEILKSMKDRRLEFISCFTKISTFSLEHLNDLSNVSDLIAAIIKQIDEEKCDLDVKTLDYLFRCFSKDLNL